jgi:hypothetical protein
MKTEVNSKFKGTNKSQGNTHGLCCQIEASTRVTLEKTANDCRHDPENGLGKEISSDSLVVVRWNSVLPYFQWPGIHDLNVL